MERRRSERFKINVDADIAFNQSNFPGIIENFSDGGLGIRYAYNKQTDDVSLGDIVNIEFNIIYQEKVNFLCKVKWNRVFDDPALGSIIRMGVAYLTQGEDL